MRDDRPPRTAAVIDTAIHATEMEVVLSIRELRELHELKNKPLDRVEPWVRIREGDEWMLSASTEIYYTEEDGA